MSSISENFGELGITISLQQIHQMEKLVVHFTLRDTNPLTLDGPYLGLHPIAFKTSDYNALFDLFHVHQKDVEIAIRQCPAIDRTFAVTSDPFNLLCMWLCHLAPIYIKNKHVCQTFMYHVLMYYHLKIFCSVVNNSFRYGANTNVMMATIQNLTRKSDIIQLESWRKLMDSHVDRILDREGKFYDILLKASPDDAFLKVISETQTALRAKIVTFANAYYDAHKAGDSMGFVSAIAQGEDGEKIIAQTASVIDSATRAMTSQLLNPNMFVNDIAVKDIANSISTISPQMLKMTLLKINETAVSQAASRKLDLVIKVKNEKIIVGTKTLVEELIQTCVRICRIKKVNLADRGKVYKTVRDAFSSSRNLDKDVLTIKNSVAYLIDPFNITTNQASQASLRLAVIYYLVYRLLNHMKV